MPFLPLLLLLLSAPAWAQLPDASPPSIAPALSTGTAVSTGTALSPVRPDEPFVLEAARRLGVPAADAVELRRRGYGKTELLSFIAIAKASPKPWKELLGDRDGGRRLREMAEDAKLDYNEVFRASSALRRDIEKSLGAPLIAP